MLLMLAVLACATDAPAPPAPQAEPPAAAPSAPPSSAPAAAPDAPEPAPGAISGAPILPDPIVLGGLSTADVVAALAGQQAVLTGCHTTHAPTKAGKVLVRFVVDGSGAVRRAELKSTSLRDDATEACVLDAVRATAFPPLTSGDTAIVTYPFSFGPT